MGFTFFSTEQKIRINLSETATLIMSEDMFQFKLTSRSTLFNVVFKNFCEEAESSVCSYLQRKIQELLSESNDTIPEIAEKDLIRIIYSTEKKRLINKIEFQKKNKHSSRIYRISNENLAFLTGDECEESDIYDDNIGLYLKCILEEYCSLPYLERERIVYKDRYELVNQAIENHCILKIRASDRKWYHVYPYSLESDSMSTRMYLVGLSKSLSNEASYKTPASFRIPGISEMKMLKKSGRLTKEELATVQNALTARKVQFLLDNEELIRIRLSDTGLKYYNSQLFLRPAYDVDLSSGNEYVFNCTQRQAEYYFFKFGKEAEVLSPPELRERFAEMYASAAEMYRDRF